MITTRRQTAAILAIAAVLFLATTLPARSAGADDLVFPLDSPAILTATFGEYRINHPHGGVDLGTEGHEGVPVLAAAAGRVTRIKVSPNGYGKVIYLSHAGGIETVYGHLSELAPKLQALASRDQSPGHYSFSRFFKADAPAVVAGEVIGYSGMTGTDVPHLHFEVRRGGLPVNPLRNGLRLPDTMPPLIEKILVEPLAADAYGPDGFERSLIDTTTLRPDTPIVIAGRVGLGVQITDHIDGSPRDLAPYDFRFDLDGKTVYRIRYDRFNYADKTVSEADYHYELKETERGILHRLYRHSIRIPFHVETGEPGVPNWVPGDHEARVVASDAAGNESALSFRLHVAAPRPALPAPVADEGGVMLAPKDSEMRDRILSLRLPENLSTVQAGSAVLVANGGSKTLPVFADKGCLLVEIPSGGRLSVIAKTTGGGARFEHDVQWVRDGATLASPGGAVAKIPGGSVFREFPVMAYEEEAPAAPGVRAVTRVQTFNQPWMPLRKPVGIRFAGADSHPSAALYLLDRGTYWHLKNGVGAAPTHLGSFLLAEDTAPPVIQRIAAEALRGRPVIIVHYEETGSGVPDWGAKLWVDGTPVLAELMPVSNAVRYIPESPLKPGTHSIRARVTDYAGHAAELTAQVTISSRRVEP